MNRLRIEHLHSDHRFQIGDAAAEAMKLQLSALLADAAMEDAVEVRGLNAASGLQRR